MDTSLPKRLQARKLALTRKDGSYYYKRGGDICGICPYAENKTCSMCGFARQNVEGILAGFSPKEAYRRAHAEDVKDSPLLMSQLENRKNPVRDANGVPLTGIELGYPNNTVLPKVHLPFFPVATQQSMFNSLNRLRQVRRTIG